MKVRIITFGGYEKYCDKMGWDTLCTDLTDEQFNAIWEWEGGEWEFTSLKGFAYEFNCDGAYAPTPNDHIIRFFPNE